MSIELNFGFVILSKFFFIPYDDVLRVKINCATGFIHCRLFFCKFPLLALAAWQKAVWLVHQWNHKKTVSKPQDHFVSQYSRSDYAGLGLGSSGKVLCLCLPRTDSEIRTKVMIASLIAKLRRAIKCLLISSTTSGTGACIPQQVQYDPESLAERESIH